MKRLEEHLCFKTKEGEQPLKETKEVDEKTAACGETKGGIPREV